jgi:hypothetical protein
MAEQTSNNDLLLDRLVELGAQVMIVHHIPGRIRLKVRLSGLLIAGQLDIEDLVNRFEGILEARANVAARSIVITYDTEAIAADLWEQLVNEKKDPTAQNSVRNELARLLKPEILDARA